MTDECEAEIRAAYARRMLELHRIGRASDGRAILPGSRYGSPAGVPGQHAVRRGGRGGHQARQAASGLSLAGVHQARYHDITPTIALHCAQRLLGRGIIL